MRKISVLTAAAFLGSFPLASWAQHDHGQHGSGGGGTAAPQAVSPHQHTEPTGHATHPSSSNKAGSVGAEQKTCPVTGKPVKADVSTTVDGQPVKFCCPSCIDKYKGKPNKYAPALYKQLYPQRIQVKCPVMGGEVDPDVFIEHNGEKVSFCCKGCDGKFEKDPAKYAANFRKAYTDQVHCPVTGERIDPQYNLETKSGTVYFSSEQCIAKYKADPDKYAADVLPAVGVLAHGRTLKEDLVRCPICPPDMVSKRGEARSVVHDGKTYFLCTDDCVSSFKADPAKYVKGLEQSAQKRTQGCAHGCAH